MLYPLGLGKRSQVDRMKEVEVGIRPRVFGRQELVSVEDRVCPGKETESLSLAGHARAAGGKADAGLRKDNAGDGDKTHELEDVDGWLFLERGARHGHEAVDRDALGRRIESAEDFKHAQAVALGLTHPDDSTAADSHPGLLDRGDRVETILKGVGGNDFRIVLGRCVDVVVVGGDAGILQLAGLLIAELAESHTDLHAELADLTNGLEHRVKAGIPRLHPLPGGSHAEACRAALSGLLGYRQDLGATHELAGLDSRVVARALGAVGAILTATACLDAQQSAELNVVLIPVLQMDGARLLDEIEEGRAIDFLETGEGDGVRCAHGFKS